MRMFHALCGVWLAFAVFYCMQVAFSPDIKEPHGFFVGCAAGWLTAEVINQFRLAAYGD